MNFEHSLTECILEREIAKTVFRERQRDRKIASFFVGIIDLRKQKLKAFWVSREAAGFSFDPTASFLPLSLIWIFQLPIHFHMHCVPKWWEFFWFCVKIFVGFGVIYVLDSEE